MAQLFPPNTNALARGSIYGAVFIIAAITCMGLRPEPEMSSTSPLLAPENDRICEKVVAPRMMKRISPEIAAVPRRAANRFFRVKEP